MCCHVLQFRVRACALKFVILCPRVTDEKTGACCDQPTLYRPTAPRIIGCESCEHVFCSWCMQPAPNWECPRASTTCKKDPLKMAVMECKTQVRTDHPSLWFVLDPFSVCSVICYSNCLTYRMYRPFGSVDTALPLTDRLATASIWCVGCVNSNHVLCV